jgi:N6-L-threonylcarbamoyladenine synthase
MITLGIETSCDETALALIETRGSGAGFECKVIASLVHSQAELHSAYGGVYPNLAKREHSKNLVPLFHKLLIESKKALEGITHSKSATVSGADFKSAIESFRAEFAAQNSDLFESFAGAEFLKSIPPIDQIAITEGPGLEPALWVGITFAKMLSNLWKIPLTPVDHMEGHVIGSLLPNDAANGAWQKLHTLPLPALAFLISGGHTELVKISENWSYEIIGQTKDDAVGEAFDKAARLLGLPYPGGPHIARLAHEAHEEKLPSPVSLPRPMISSKDLDFSFSGLKTAVLYAVRKAADEKGQLSDSFKKGLAHEFEMAVSDTLDSKLRAAIDKVGAQAVIIGGGVSANHVLRERFEKTAAEFSIPIYLPSRHISGDNALMIALAGAFHPHTKTPGNIRALGTKRLSDN